MLKFTLTQIFDILTQNQIGFAFGYFDEDGKIDPDTFMDEEDFCEDDEPRSLRFSICGPRTTSSLTFEDSEIKLEPIINLIEEHYPGMLEKSYNPFTTVDSSLHTAAYALDSIGSDGVNSSITHNDKHFASTFITLNAELAAKLKEVWDRNEEEKHNG